MRLILVRHGLTDDNVANIAQGQLGESLNERGEQQAEAIGRRLAIQRIDGIFSSDLGRAWRTAMAISGHHRYLVPRVDRRLRERSFGELGGRPLDDFAAAADEVKTPLTHYRPQHGESSVDVAQRAQRWHDDMLRRHYGQLIVVVSHGGWLRSYLTWLFHSAIDERNRNYKHYNTGMTVVDLHEAKPKLIMLNDISHLG